MDVGYKKEYKMRRVVKTADSIVVTIPFEVIQRQATIAGLTVDEFVQQFVAEAEYNNFEGVHYTFKKVTDGGAQNGETT